MQAVGSGRLRIRGLPRPSRLSVPTSPAGAPRASAWSSPVLTCCACKRPGSRSGIVRPRRRWPGVGHTTFTSAGPRATVRSWPRQPGRGWRGSGTTRSPTPLPVGPKGGSSTSWPIWGGRECSTSSRSTARVKGGARRTRTSPWSSRPWPGCAAWATCQRSLWATSTSGSTAAALMACWRCPAGPTCCATKGPRAIRRRGPPPALTAP
eukprot:5942594-Lingulodinium_polyedra.AAC.1